MAYIVVALLGMAGGAFCVFMILEAQRKRLGEQKEEHQASSEALKIASQAYSAKKAVFEKELAQFKAAEAALASSVVPYRELQDENAIVKRDLHNLEVHVRKLKLDQELQRKTQETLDVKVTELGSRYLKENVKWLSSSLNAAQLCELQTAATGRYRPLPRNRLRGSCALRVIAAHRAPGRVSEGRQGGLRA